ncbi:Methyltransferase type 11 [Acidisarcina polymorpha]|uniref:Methyltransferase type 11 n=1 Tax=Acidisarcina polymorpha TaxID=2211140 RepID=A0A2Z5G2D8_9BACT|nr:class I SAM-dependent methyltransferase [Acidisarcina polymorpha]AXC13291.1 Methyltransferase type 11 [Acidisarcina polymorpha]
MGTQLSASTSNLAAHLELGLRCPSCRAAVDGLSCDSCGFQMGVSDDIVQALPPDRVTHYAQFIHDYERIRAAEGRGSEDDEFYLGLPYKDASGMNSKQWRIRARSYDYLQKHLLKQIPRSDGGLILDLGAGNGWMSYRLATAGYKPVAVDLLTNDRDGLGAAEHYRKLIPKLFPRFQAELACLPFQDAQFDAVIFNASFHYSEDYQATLGEALRCVRKSGLVIISDTPWYSSEDSGQRMVSERQAHFCRSYGTASDSIKSLEFLTEERLRRLEEYFSIQMTAYSPYYGLQWAARPLLAKLRNKREPSQFRIFAARR